MSFLNKFKTSTPSLVQVDENPQFRAVMHAGNKVKIFPGQHQFNDESPQLAKAYTFHIIGLSDGQFKFKSLNRTHLSEMKEMFEDI
jgi:hypothetical protein